MKSNRSSKVSTNISGTTNRERIEITNDNTNIIGNKNSSQTSDDNVFIEENVNVSDDKFSLTDKWVSETVRMVTSNTIHGSTPEQNVEHILSSPAATSTYNKKNGSRRKTRKRSLRKASIASSISEHETATIKSTRSGKRGSLQVPMPRSEGKALQVGSSDKTLEDCSSDTIPFVGEIRNVEKVSPTTTSVNETGKETKSKLELPSLVFTAATSNLDEGMGNGQSLNHISYSMNELTNHAEPTTSEKSYRHDNHRKSKRDKSKDNLKSDTEGKPAGKDDKRTKRSRRRKKAHGDADDLEDDITDRASSPIVVASELLHGAVFERNKDYIPDKGRRSLSENPIVSRYFKVCKKLGVLPLRKVIQQFGRPHMTFKNLTLTTRDMKALCLSLQKETYASSLDFTGNFIQARELSYVIAVLNRLHTIFQVSLCNNCLHGQGISEFSRFLLMNDFLTRLDLSGNKLTDHDAPCITAILKANITLKTLLLNHNEFREEGGKLIGQAIAENTTLEDIDLSWNHLRRSGAIGIANGLQENTALRTVNLAWNGFGFEGCVAIGDMMCTNTTITELDLAYNRISPPALLELLRGIAGNKTLRILKIGYNPVTASFSSLILVVVKKHRESALENIDMAGVVVDKEFVALLEEIQKDRFFIVNYEVSLPVKKMSREEMREKIGLPSAYNVDPLRMLYLLKVQVQVDNLFYHIPDPEDFFPALCSAMLDMELGTTLLGGDMRPKTLFIPMSVICLRWFQQEKMRASDFFYKINKDNDDGLQRDELYELFDEAGLPVTSSVVDKIMEFMDTNGDGTIDLGEFLQGDKRIKIISRKQLKDEQERRAKDGKTNKYSRTFQKAHLDPISLALKVEPTSTPMRQSTRRLSGSKHDSDAEDNNHLKIP